MEFKNTIFRLSLDDFNNLTDKIARLELSHDKMLEIMGARVLMQGEDLDLKPRNEELDVCLVYDGTDGNELKKLLIDNKISFDSLEPYIDGGYFRRYLKGKLIKEGEDISILQ